MEMKKGTALFYSISGMAAARTKSVYSRLEELLPSAFPELKIAFLGCPFAMNGKRKFPLPLLWSAEERDMHPTTRLFSCWKRLNEFAVGTLRPALQKYDIVVVERLGLDAQLYSTARTDSAVAIDETERVHHALVKMRIVEQGISPPRYFIPIADERDAARLVESFPKLRGFDPRLLQSFMRHEKDALARYFDPSHGQRKPVYLPISMSVDEMVEEIITFIGKDVKKYFAA